jgi:hypothetical protein
VKSPLRPRRRQPAVALNHMGHALPEPARAIKLPKLNPTLDKITSQESIVEQTSCGVGRSLIERSIDCLSITIIVAAYVPDDGV